IATVVIPDGASQQSSNKTFEPDVITVVVGKNNTVKWINEDNVAHTIVSSSGYVDPVSGKFATPDQPDRTPGGYILPGQAYNFTFKEKGTYDYHSVPQPFLQASH